MAKAVLVDLCSLKPTTLNSSTQELLIRTLETFGKEDSGEPPCIYLMCCQTPSNGRKAEDVFRAIGWDFQGLKKEFEVVSAQSTAAALYTVKKHLDEKDVSRIKMILPSQRIPVMKEFINKLFTSVYQFEFEDLQMNCEENHLKQSPGSPSELMPLKDQDLDEIQREIRSHLGSLPSLKGEITILKSVLIPGNVGQRD